MQQRGLCNFKTGDTICFYHQKVYHTRYESLQLYCFDQFQLHKKKISKGIYIPESTSAVTLKMKPWKSLCVNCMKLQQKKLKFLESSDDGKNDGQTEKNPDCIGHEINGTIPKDSANLLGLSAIKPVGKQDRAGYGKQKVEKKLVDFITSLAPEARRNYYIMIFQNVPNAPTQIN